MLTIKITNSRAIIVHANNVALAAWKKKKNPQTKEIYHGWEEYMWPSSMDRAIERLAQEFVSDMDMTVTMVEFKAYFNDAFNKIKKLIDEAGTKEG